MSDVASSADKYMLYQQSVQVADNEVDFFDRVYKAAYGSSPVLLREDFCGTHAICCEWVKSDGNRRAIGVDYDPEPLDWGQAHNQAPLSEDEKGRIELVQDDVRATGQERADVIGAENFSYMIFKTRDELRGYFEKTLANLKDEGVLVCDIMGGSELLDEDHQDERLFSFKPEEDDYEEVEEEPEHDFSKFNGFMYVWDQAAYCSITHDAKYHIHFQFPDGSEMKEAFTYDWRLWSIPEIKELMLEAGYKQVDIYWEGTEDDEEGESVGNGVYDIQTSAPPDPAWIAYIVATR